MSSDTPPGTDPQVGTVQIRVDRVIVMTLTLMSVLIVYDGWESLSYLGVVVVIVGPVLAILLSHVFAATLAVRVATARPLNQAE